MAIDIFTGCQAPNGCRRLAIKRLQGGHMGATLEVDVDMELCAYCAADFEEEYRDANPDGFVREVPA